MAPTTTPGIERSAFLSTLVCLLGFSSAYRSFCSPFHVPSHRPITVGRTGTLTVCFAERDATPVVQRRMVLRLGGLVASSVFFWKETCDSANAEILQVGSCASGEGEGCADLSEGNEFIRSLQQKSAVKREFYAKVRFYVLADTIFSC